MNEHDDTKVKGIRHCSKMFAICTPIALGFTILLGGDMTFWISQGNNTKVGLSYMLVSFLVESFFQIIPFVAITLFMRELIRKGTHRNEIAIKTVLVLVPITFVTLYWRQHYSLSPFVLGLLPFINFFIILSGWAIGKVIYRRADLVM